MSGEWRGRSPPEGEGTPGIPLPALAHGNARGPVATNVCPPPLFHLPYSNHSFSSEKDVFHARHMGQVAAMTNTFAVRFSYSFALSPAWREAFIIPCSSDGSSFLSLKVFFKCCAVGDTMIRVVQSLTVVIDEESPPPEEDDDYGFRWA